MNNCKKGKEDIKTKVDKGIFKTCAKPNTATGRVLEARRQQLTPDSLVFLRNFR